LKRLREKSRHWECWEAYTEASVEEDEVLLDVAATKKKLQKMGGT